MPFSPAAKQSMLDFLANGDTSGPKDIDAVGIHTGDPGAAGTSNEVSGGGYSRLNPTFEASPSGDDILLTADLDFSGPADEDATWFSIWCGATFAGRGQITSGDTTFNAAGEFSLTTATKLQLTDV